MNIGTLFVLFGVKVQQEQFKAADKALKVLKIAIAALGVAKLGRELVDMAEEAAKSATHILGMSSALGMSAKTVQEWSYVAQQAGSDINQFSVGISMFERNLREFAAGRGSKRFIDSMHAIRLSRTEAKRDLAGPDGVNAALFKVSDAYLKMGNSANRAAINTGLFGARARGMAQDLGRGSAVLREQIRHVHAIGGIVGDNELQNLKKFNNAINDIKVAWHGLTMTVIGELAPAFTAMLQEVTTFIVENKDAIRNVLEAGFTALTFLFKAMMAVVRLFSAALEGNVAAQAVVITLAGLLISLLVPALYLVAGAAWAALAPLLIPTAIIGGIIFGILQLREHWDEITEALGNAWEATKAKWSQFWQWVKHEVSKIGDAVIGAAHAVGHFVIRVKDIVVGLGHSIKEWLVGVWDTVGQKARAVIDWIMDKVHWLERQLAKVANKIPGVNVHWGEGDMAGGGEPAAPTTLKQAFANTLGVTPGQLNEAMASVTRNALSPFGSHELRAYTEASRSAQSQTARAPAASAAAMAAVSDRPTDRKPSNVSVGPTTININGVKDATEAKDHIADSIDGMHRHAAAAMGGEIQ